MGWTSQVARQVIVDGAGNDQGIFVYDGVPANGNLIVSIAAHTGSDQYGNTYPPGLFVAAGVIEGGVFEGNDFIINQAGSFFYSGTPANGNLIASIASTGGTDGFGNSYEPGINVYGTGTSLTGIQNSSGEAVLFFMPDSSSAFSNAISPAIFSLDTGSGTAEYMELQIGSGAPSGLPNRRSRVILFSGSPDGTTSVPHVGVYGGNNDALIADFNPNGITAVQPGTSATLETWHNITLDSGWTAGAQPPQFRMLPDGNVQVRGQATHSGVTAATNINGSNPIPSAYWPAETRIYRPPDAGDAAATVDITTVGIFVARASGFTATSVAMDGIYST